MIAYGLFLGLMALIVVLAVLRRGEAPAEDDSPTPNDRHAEDD